MSRRRSSWLRSARAGWSRTGAGRRAGRAGGRRGGGEGSSDVSSDLRSTELARRATGARCPGAGPPGSAAPGPAGRGPGRGGARGGREGGGEGERGVQTCLPICDRLSWPVVQLAHDVPAQVLLAPQRQGRLVEDRGGPARGAGGRAAGRGRGEFRRVFRSAID